MTKNSSPTLSLKHRLGKFLIPKLPLNRHVFNHFRLELNAWIVRTLYPLNPVYQIKVRRLKQGKNLLVNIGCGPFGKSNWINLDLFPHQEITVRSDCRRLLPLADSSCLGIHVEHFFEHLNPGDEVPDFLRECYRCLEPNGVLRIIVPDAELYVRAYFEPGWDLINRITCGGDKPEQVFGTKMQVLNHIFLQEWEHYAGYDAETLELVLKLAGFTEVTRCNWREGEFPNGCIDREQHRSYSLYMEAKR